VTNSDTESYPVQFVDVVGVLLVLCRRLQCESMASSRVLDVQDC